MNLKTYILDHAVASVNHLKEDFDEADKRNQHFTLSVDMSQLIVKHNCRTQKDIDNIMQNFMNDLLEHEHEFKESKGRRNGKQRFRTVNFDFQDTLVAYHNAASDNENSQNYNVMPHLHILANRKKKIGIGYKQLRVAIDEVSKKYNIVFQFQEEVENKKNNSLKFKCTTFSWFLKKAREDEFLKRIVDNKLDTDINNIIQNYKNTNNLSYYIKTFRDLQHRLKKQNQDYFFNNVNIKDEFPLFLSNADLKDLEVLHKGEDTKRIYEILSDRNSQIGRSYIEYNNNFNNTIFDELEKRGSTFAKLDINYERLNLKINRKESTNNSFEKTINYCYQEDFKSAATVAKNEKELQEKMKKLGYSNFKYKQKNIDKKRQKVGFTFQNKNKKNVTVYFNNININLADIRKKLKKNKETKVEDVDLYSYLYNYKSKIQTKKNIEYFEEIYNFTLKNDISSYYIKELGEKVQLIKKDVFIEDLGNQIVTKFNHKNIDESVDIILELALKKGWDLDKVKVHGSDKFKQKVTQKIEQIQQEKELLKNHNLDHEIASKVEALQKQSQYSNLEI